MAKLTPSQRAAVECDESLIIFAGPGSGKTSTSVAKARRILSSPGNRIVLCTFSVEAARELDKRLRASFERSGENYPAARSRVGTLDSCAYQHLRQTRSMPAELMSPKVQGSTLRRIGMSLDGIESLEDVLASVELMQCALDPMARLATMPTQMQKPAGTLFRLFQDRLQASGLIDLSGVKRLCATRLDDASLPLFRTEAGECTHLIVDEEQDCDEIQLTIAIAHAKRGCIVTLVGDDDQSIYTWRGATGYPGMQQFVAATRAQRVVLVENFRSHSEIVEHAARLISYNNPFRVDKPQLAVNGPGGVISVFQCASVEAECDRIVATLSVQRSELGSVAVLARRNHVLDTLETALPLSSDETIQWRRVGGSSMWARDDVRAYLALLSYVADDSLGSLGLVLQWYDVETALTTDLLNEMRRAPDLDPLEALSSLPSIVPLDSARLQRLFEGVHLQRRNLAEGALEMAIAYLASEFRQMSFGGTGRSDTEEQGRDDPDRRARANLLPMLERVNKTIASMSDSLSLSRRLMRLAYLDSKTDEIGDEVVRLMTMHASKGLEFDTVFLLDCAEGELDSTATASADERRVMYVAMTRARRTLQISFTGTMPIFLRQAGLEVSAA